MMSYVRTRLVLQKRTLLRLVHAETECGNLTLVTRDILFVRKHTKLHCNLSKTES